MVKIENEDVKEAVKKLTEAFNHQFAVKLLVAEVLEDGKSLKLFDKGQGTPLDRNGSLRGKWLAKNGERFGFKVGEHGEVEYVGVAEPEVVTPAPELAAVEATPVPSNVTNFHDHPSNRKSRRQEAEDGTNKES